MDVKFLNVALTSLLSSPYRSKWILWCALYVVLLVGHWMSGYWSMIIWRNGRARWRQARGVFWLLGGLPKVWISSPRRWGGDGRCDRIIEKINIRLCFRAQTCYIVKLRMQASAQNSAPKIRMWGLGMPQTLRMRNKPWKELKFKNLARAHI